MNVFNVLAMVVNKQVKARRLPKMRFDVRLIAATPTKTVIVVEGYFDCLRVHQAGLPGVVALMGAVSIDKTAEGFARTIPAGSSIARRG